MGEIGRTLWRHSSQRSSRPLGAAAVLAGADLGDEPGLNLLGLDSAVDADALLALAAGDRVTAGVDDHPPALAPLVDHGGLLATPPNGMRLPVGCQPSKQRNRCKAVSCGFARPWQESNLQPTD